MKPYMEHAQSSRADQVRSVPWTTQQWWRLCWSLQGVKSMWGRSFSTGCVRIGLNRYNCAWRGQGQSGEEGGGFFKVFFHASTCGFACQEQHSLVRCLKKDPRKVKPILPHPVWERKSNPFSLVLERGFYCTGWTIELSSDVQFCDPAQLELQCSGRKGTMTSSSWISTLKYHT